MFNILVSASCFSIFFFFFIFLAHLTVFFSILLKRTKTITLNIYEKKTTLLNITFVIFLCVKIYVIFWDCSKCIMYTYSNEYKYELSFYEQQQKSLVPTFTFLISSSATLNVCYSLYQVTRSRIWALPHT